VYEFKHAPWEWEVHEKGHLSKCHEEEEGSSRVTRDDGGLHSCGVVRKGFSDERTLEQRPEDVKEGERKTEGTATSKGLTQDCEFTLNARKPL
jgi:hypothetical protein